MDEQPPQEPHDPLSFKGQMAARYRERMTMGFALGNNDRGETESARMTTALGHTSAEPSGPQVGHGAPKAVEKGASSNEGPNPGPGDLKTFLTTTRSRSIVVESSLESGKPAMKDLITKFERRSFTATQLKREKSEGGEARIARNAWRLNPRGVNMELDPSAKTSSSCSEEPDDRSLSSDSKPPCAKTSKATLSLNNETARPVPQILSLSSSVMLTSEAQITCSSCDGLASEGTKKANTQGGNNNVVSQPDPKDVKISSQALKLEGTDLEKQAANIFNTSLQESGQGDKLQPTQVGNPGMTTPPPLRVSLRGIAARRQKKDIFNNMKYVVHKKDWSKRFQSQQLVPGEAIFMVNKPKNPTESLRSRSRSDKENVVQVKEGEARGDDSKPSLRPPITVPSITQQGLGKKLWSRRLKEENPENRSEEKRAKAMERYLHFLKKNNHSMPLHLTDGDKKGDRPEKAETLKTCRPPTPHRTQILRKNKEDQKKNCALGKEGNVTTRSTVTTPSIVEGSSGKENMEKESRTALLSRFRPRVRQSSLAKTKKDALSDFKLNLGASSTSITSSLCDDPARLLDSRLSTPLPIRPTSKVSKPPTKTAPSSRANLSLVRPQAGDEKPSKTYSPFTRKRLTPPSMTPEAPKRRILSENKTAPKNADCISSSPQNSGQKTQKEEDTKSKKMDTHQAFDFGTNILTEDEMADNDLVPSYLRDRKIPFSCGNVPLLLSSSDDSYSMHMDSSINTLRTAPLFKVVSNPDGNTTTLANTSNPPRFNPGDKTNLRYVGQPESKHPSKSPAMPPDNIEESKPCLLKERKAGLGKWKDETCDERSHRNVCQQSTKWPGHVMESSGTAGKSGLSFTPLHRTASRKESEQTRCSPNLPSYVVPDDLASGLTLDEEVGNASEDRFGTPLPTLSPAPHRPGCRLKTPIRGLSLLEKETASTMATLEQPRSMSPKLLSRRPPSVTATRVQPGSAPKVRVENIGAGEPPRDESQLPMRLTMSPSLHHKNVEITMHPFHFGDNEMKLEDADNDVKREKSAVSSPQKKKRKLDKTRKLKKKKKKKKEDGDDDPDTTSHVQPVQGQRIHKEGKLMKDRIREKVVLKPLERSEKQEKSEKTSRSEKLEKAPKPLENVANELPKCQTTNRQYLDSSSPKRCSRESSSVALVKVHHSADSSTLSTHHFMPKVLSRESSPLTPKWHMYKKDYTSITLPSIHTVGRLSCEPTSNWPIKSRIPLITELATPRKRLDVLIQYRRWREAILDCLHPSKIPLSDSFRKRLDSAVVEEWALHCWQPPRDMYMDSQGVWWSTSFDDLQESSEFTGDPLTSVVSRRERGGRGRGEGGGTNPADLETMRERHKWISGTSGTDICGRISCRWICRQGCDVSTAFIARYWTLLSGPGGLNSSQLKQNKDDKMDSSGHSEINGQSHHDLTRSRRYPRTVECRKTNFIRPSFSIILDKANTSHHSPSQPLLPSTARYPRINSDIFHVWSLKLNTQKIKMVTLKVEADPTGQIESLGLCTACSCALVCTAHVQSTHTLFIIWSSRVSSPFTDNMTAKVDFSCWNSQLPVMASPHWTSNDTAILNCNNNSASSRPTNKYKPFVYSVHDRSPRLGIAVHFIRIRHRRFYKKTKSFKRAWQIIAFIANSVKGKSKVQSNDLSCASWTDDVSGSLSQTKSARSSLTGNRCDGGRYVLHSRSLTSPLCRTHIHRYHEQCRSRHRQLSPGSCHQGGRNLTTPCSETLIQSDVKKQKWVWSYSSCESYHVNFSPGSCGDSARPFLLQRRERNNNSRGHGQVSGDSGEFRGHLKLFSQWPGKKDSSSTVNKKDHHYGHCEGFLLEDFGPNPQDVALHTRREKRNHRPRPWKRSHPNTGNNLPLQIGQAKGISEDDLHFIQVQLASSIIIPEKPTSTASTRRLESRHLNPIFPRRKLLKNGQMEHRCKNSSNKTTSLSHTQNESLPLDQQKDIHILSESNNAENPPVSQSGTQGSVFMTSLSEDPVLWTAQTNVVIEDPIPKSLPNTEWVECQARKSDVPIEVSTTQSNIPNKSTCQNDITETTHSKIEPNTHNNRGTANTFGFVSRDKKLGASNFQGENSEARRTQAAKCDDTDTCRTSPTLNDDTTGSNTPIRERRKMSARPGPRKVFIDPKITAEMQRKVKTLVLSYKEFLEKEESQHRYQKLVADEDSCCPKAEMAKQQPSLGPLASTAWSDGVFSAPVVDYPPLTKPRTETGRMFVFPQSRGHQAGDFTVKQIFGQTGDGEANAQAYAGLVNSTFAGKRQDLMNTLQPNDLNLYDKKINLDDLGLLPEEWDQGAGGINLEKTDETFNRVDNLTCNYLSASQKQQQCEALLSTGHEKSPTLPAALNPPENVEDWTSRTTNRKGNPEQKLGEKRTQETIEAHRYLTCLIQDKSSVNTFRSKDSHLSPFNGKHCGHVDGFYLAHTSPDKDLTLRKSPNMSTTDNTRVKKRLNFGGKSKKSQLHFLDKRTAPSKKKPNLLSTLSQQLCRKGGPLKEISSKSRDVQTSAFGRPSELSTHYRAGRQYNPFYRPASPSLPGKINVHKTFLEKTDANHLPDLEKAKAKGCKILEENKSAATGRAQVSLTQHRQQQQQSRGILPVTTTQSFEPSSKSARLTGTHKEGKLMASKKPNTKEIIQKIGSKNPAVTIPVKKVFPWRLRQTQKETQLATGPKVLGALSSLVRERPSYPGSALQRKGFSPSNKGKQRNVVNKTGELSTVDTRNAQKFGTTLGKQTIKSQDNKIHKCNSASKESPKTWQAFMRYPPEYRADQSRDTTEENNGNIRKYLASTSKMLFLKQSSANVKKEKALEATVSARATRSTLVDTDTGTDSELKRCNSSEYFKRRHKNILTLQEWRASQKYKIPPAKKRRPEKQVRDRTGHRMNDKPTRNVDFPEQCIKSGAKRAAHERLFYRSDKTQAGKSRRFERGKAPDLNSPPVSKSSSSFHSSDTTANKTKAFFKVAEAELRNKPEEQAAFTFRDVVPQFLSSTSSWRSASDHFESAACEQNSENSSLSSSDAENENDGVQAFKDQKASPDYDCVSPKCFADDEMSSSDNGIGKSEMYLSSLSTMRSIPDLPFNYLSSNDTYKFRSQSSGSSHGGMYHLVKQTNLQVPAVRKSYGKGDNFERVDYNFSNRRFRQSTSEPNITTTSISTRSRAVRVSHSLLDLRCPNKVLQAYPLLDSPSAASIFKTKDASTSLALLSSRKMSATGSPKLNDKCRNRTETFLRKDCGLKSPSQSSSLSGFLSELRCVFKRKNLLDLSHNRTPIRRLPKVYSKRIKYSPRSALEESSTSFLSEQIPCDLTLATAAAPSSGQQVSSKRVAASERQSKHTMSPNMLKISGQTIQTDEKSPRSHPFFASIVDFWERFRAVAGHDGRGYFVDGLRGKSRDKHVKAAKENSDSSSLTDASMYFSVTDSSDTPGLGSTQHLSKPVCHSRKRSQKFLTSKRERHCPVLKYSLKPTRLRKRKRPSHCLSRKSVCNGSELLCVTPLTVRKAHISKLKEKVQTLATKSNIVLIPVNVQATDHYKTLDDKRVRSQSFVPPGNSEDQSSLSDLISCNESTFKKGCGKYYTMEHLQNSLRHFLKYSCPSSQNQKSSTGSCSASDPQVAKEASDGSCQSQSNQIDVAEHHPSKNIHQQLLNQAQKRAGHKKPLTTTHATSDSTVLSPDVGSSLSRSGKQTSGGESSGTLPGEESELAPRHPKNALFATLASPHAGCFNDASRGSLPKSKHSLALSSSRGTLAAKCRSGKRIYGDSKSRFLNKHCHRRKFSQSASRLRTPNINDTPLPQTRDPPNEHCPRGPGPFEASAGKQKIGKKDTYSLKTIPQPSLNSTLQRFQQNSTQASFVPQLCAHQPQASSPDVSHSYSPTVQTTTLSSGKSIHQPLVKCSPQPPQNNLECCELETSTPKVRQTILQAGRSDVAHGAQGEQDGAKLHSKFVLDSRSVNDPSCVLTHSHNTDFVHQQRCNSSPQSCTNREHGTYNLQYAHISGLLDSLYPDRDFLVDPQNPFCIHANIGVGSSTHPIHRQQQISRHETSAKTLQSPDIGQQCRNDALKLCQCPSRTSGFHPALANTEFPIHKFQLGNGCHFCTENTITHQLKSCPRKTPPLKSFTTSKKGLECKSREGEFGVNPSAINDESKPHDITCFLRETTSTEKAGAYRKLFESPSQEKNVYHTTEIAQYPSAVGQEWQAHEERTKRREGRCSEEERFSTKVDLQRDLIQKRWPCPYEVSKAQLSPDVVDSGEVSVITRLALQMRCRPRGSSHRSREAHIYKPSLSVGNSPTSLADTGGCSRESLQFPFMDLSPIRTRSIQSRRTKLYTQRRRDSSDHARTACVSRGVQYSVPCFHPSKEYLISAGLDCTSDSSSKSTPEASFPKTIDACTSYHTQNNRPRDLYVNKCLCASSSSSCEQCGDGVLHRGQQSKARQSNGSFNLKKKWGWKIERSVKAGKKTHLTRGEQWRKQEPRATNNEKVVQCNSKSCCSSSTPTFKIQRDTSYKNNQPTTDSVGTRTFSSPLHANKQQESSFVSSSSVNIRANLSKNRESDPLELHSDHSETTTLSQLTQISWRGQRLDIPKRYLKLSCEKHAGLLDQDLLMTSCMSGPEYPRAKRKSSRQAKQIQESLCDLAVHKHLTKASAQRVSAESRQAEPMEKTFHRRSKFHRGYKNSGDRAACPMAAVPVLGESPQEGHAQRLISPVDRDYQLHNLDMAKLPAGNHRQARSNFSCGEPVLLKHGVPHDSKVPLSAASKGGVYMSLSRDANVKSVKPKGLTDNRIVLHTSPRKMQQGSRDSHKWSSRTFNLRDSHEDVDLFQGKQVLGDVHISQSIGLLFSASEHTYIPRGSSKKITVASPESSIPKKQKKRMDLHLDKNQGPEYSLWPSHGKAATITHTTHPSSLERVKRLFDLSALKVTGRQTSSDKYWSQTLSKNGQEKKWPLCSRECICQLMKQANLQESEPSKTVSSESESLPGRTSLVVVKGRPFCEAKLAPASVKVHSTRLLNHTVFPRWSHKATSPSIYKHVYCYTGTDSFPSVSNSAPALSAKSSLLPEARRDSSNTNEQMKAANNASNMADDCTRDLRIKDHVIRLGGKKPVFKLAETGLAGHPVLKTKVAGKKYKLIPYQHKIGSHRHRLCRNSAPPLFVRRNDKTAHRKPDGHFLMNKYLDDIQLANLLTLAPTALTESTQQNSTRTWETQKYSPRRSVKLLSQISQPVAAKVSDESKCSLSAVDISQTRRKCTKSKKHRSAPYSFSLSGSDDMVTELLGNIFDLPFFNKRPSGHASSTRRQEKAPKTGDRRQGHKVSSVGQNRYIDKVFIHKEERSESNALLSELTLTDDDESSTKAPTSSTGARDIEIVLGNDISVKEFLTCFMNGLQLQSNNSRLPSDCGRKESSLQSQVRLVIDKIFGGDHGGSQTCRNNTAHNPHKNDRKSPKTRTASLTLQTSAQGSKRRHMEGNRSLQTAHARKILPRDQQSHYEAKLKELFTQEDCNGAKQIYHSPRTKQTHGCRVSRMSKKIAFDCHPSLIGRRTASVSHRHTHNDTHTRRSKNSKGHFVSSGESVVRPFSTGGNLLGNECYVTASLSDSILSMPSSKTYRKARRQNAASAAHRSSTCSSGNETKLPSTNSSDVALYEHSSECTTLGPTMKDVRKMPLETIQINKPRDCCLDKLIRQDNQLLVKFAPLGMVKRYESMKTQPRGHKRGKGLNETLVEKESQSLLFERSERSALTKDYVTCSEKEPWNDDQAFVGQLLVPAYKESRGKAVLPPRRRDESNERRRKCGHERTDKTGTSSDNITATLSSAGGVMSRTSQNSSKTLTTIASTSYNILSSAGDSHFSKSYSTEVMKSAKVTKKSRTLKALPKMLLCASASSSWSTGLDVFLTRANRKSRPVKSEEASTDLDSETYETPHRLTTPSGSTTQADVNKWTAVVSPKTCSKDEKSIRESIRLLMALLSKRKSGQSGTKRKSRHLHEDDKINPKRTNETCKKKNVSTEKRKGSRARDNNGRDKRLPQETGISASPEPKRLKSMSQPPSLETVKALDNGQLGDKQLFETVQEPSTQPIKQDSPKVSTGVNANTQTKHESTMTENEDVAVSPKQVLESMGSLQSSVEQVILPSTLPQNKCAEPVLTLDAKAAATSLSGTNFHSISTLPTAGATDFDEHIVKATSTTSISSQRVNRLTHCWTKAPSSDSREVGSTRLSAHNPTVHKSNKPPPPPWSPRQDITGLEARGSYEERREVFCWLDEKKESPQMSGCEASGPPPPSPRPLKIKAPCSLYTGKYVNLALAQDSDSSCVKLVLLQEDSSDVCEVLVEAGKDSVGAPRIVAENGFVHVTFDAAKGEEGDVCGKEKGEDMSKILSLKESSDTAGGNSNSESSPKKTSPVCYKPAFSSKLAIIQSESQCHFGGPQHMSDPLELSKYRPSGRLSYLRAKYKDASEDVSSDVSWQRETSPKLDHTVGEHPLNCSEKSGSQVNQQFNEQTCRYKLSASPTAGEEADGPAANKVREKLSLMFSPKRLSPTLNPPYRSRLSDTLRTLELRASATTAGLGTTPTLSPLKSKYSSCGTSTDTHSRVSDLLEGKESRTYRTNAPVRSAESIRGKPASFGRYTRFIGKTISPSNELAGVLRKPVPANNKQYTRDWKDAGNRNLHQDRADLPVSSSRCSDRKEDMFWSRDGRKSAAETRGDARETDTRNPWKGHENNVVQEPCEREGTWSRYERKKAFGTDVPWEGRETDSHISRAKDVHWEEGENAAKRSQELTLSWEDENHGLMSLPRKSASRIQKISNLSYRESLNPVSIENSQRARSELDNHAKTLISGGESRNDLPAHYRLIQGERTWNRNATYGANKHRKTAGVSNNRTDNKNSDSSDSSGSSDDSGDRSEERETKDANNKDNKKQPSNVFLRESDKSPATESKLPSAPLSANSSDASMPPPSSKASQPSRAKKRPSRSDDKTSTPSTAPQRSEASAGKDAKIKAKPSVSPISPETKANQNDSPLPVSQARKLSTHSDDKIPRRSSKIPYRSEVSAELAETGRDIEAEESPISPELKTNQRDPPLPDRQIRRVSSSRSDDKRRPKPSKNRVVSESSAELAGTGLDIDYPELKTNQRDPPLPDRQIRRVSSSRSDDKRRPKPSKNRVVSESSAELAGTGLDIDYPELKTNQRDPPLPDRQIRRVSSSRSDDKRRPKPSKNRVVSESSDELAGTGLDIDYPELKTNQRDPPLPDSQVRRTSSSPSGDKRRRKLSKNRFVSETSAELEGKGFDSNSRSSLGDSMLPAKASTSQKYIDTRKSINRKSSSNARQTSKKPSYPDSFSETRENTESSESSSDISSVNREPESVKSAPVQKPKSRANVPQTPSSSYCSSSDESEDEQDKVIEGREENKVSGTPRKPSYDESPPKQTRISSNILQCRTVSGGGRYPLLTKGSQRLYPGSGSSSPDFSPPPHFSQRSEKVSVRNMSSPCAKWGSNNPCLKYTGKLKRFDGSKDFTTEGNPRYSLMKNPSPCSSLGSWTDSAIKWNSGRDYLRSRAEKSETIGDELSSSHLSDISKCSSVRTPPFRPETDTFSSTHRDRLKSVCRNSTSFAAKKDVFYLGKFSGTGLTKTSPPDICSSYSNYSRTDKMDGDDGSKMYDLDFKQCKSSNDVPESPRVNRVRFSDQVTEFCAPYAAGLSGDRIKTCPNLNSFSSKFSFSQMNKPVTSSSLCSPMSGMGKYIPKYATMQGSNERTYPSFPVVPNTQSKYRPTLPLLQEKDNWSTMLTSCVNTGLEQQSLSRLGPQSYFPGKGIWGQRAFNMPGHFQTPVLQPGASREPSPFRTQYSFAGYDQTPVWPRGSNVLQRLKNKPGTNMSPTKGGFPSIYRPTPVIRQSETSRCQAMNCNTPECIDSGYSTPMSGGVSDWDLTVQEKLQRRRLTNRRTSAQQFRFTITPRSGFSKEGFLDFSARLPYMKVGPVRVKHGGYLLLAVFSLVMCQMVVRLYQCGGDEYEYFCPDDDLECLVQSLAAI